MTAQTAASPPVTPSLGGEAAPTVSFHVLDRPAPQGSKSYKGKSKAGRAIMVESSKKVPTWREAVKAAAAEAIAAHPDLTFPFDGPLYARMVFTLPKPTSAPKTRRTWPTKYPDLSKLTRSTEDAIVAAGLIADDARFVDLHLSKRYPGDPDEFVLPVPGVHVVIGPVL